MLISLTVIRLIGPSGKPHANVISLCADLILRLCFAAPQQLILLANGHTVHLRFTRGDEGSSFYSMSKQNRYRWNMEGAGLCLEFSNLIHTSGK